jgi:hypothetical protein
MTTLPIRIHFMANLALITALAIWTSDILQWPGLLIITYVFTLPVVPFLMLLMWLISKMKLSLFFNWMFFVLSVAAFSFIPIMVIGFFTGDIEPEILSFSMPAAFAGVLLQLKPIHKFLKQYSYEQDPFEAI